MSDGPNHEWQGIAGHNCTGCPEVSVWRCDEMAHAPAFLAAVRRRYARETAERNLARFGGAAGPGIQRAP